MKRCPECGILSRSSPCLECQQRAELHDKGARSRARAARGGRSPSSTYRPGRAKWRIAVKERDGYRCRVCGGTKRLEAHHIVSVAEGGGDTLGNGVTLCGACHRASHGGPSL